jgi:DNA-binding MarR family transcriptional regulator
MQPLQCASIDISVKNAAGKDSSGKARSGEAQSGPARGRQCAEEVMSAVPPVVWYMRRQMRSHRGGLSMPQFRALVRVQQDGAASISSISEHLATSLSTTSRLVSGLVGRGLLKRESTPNDRRQVHVTITQTGRAVLDKARQATRGKLETALASMEAPEEKTVIDAMQILRRIFGRGSQFDAMRSADRSKNGSNGKNGDAHRRKRL